MKEEASWSILGGVGLECWGCGLMSDTICGFVCVGYFLRLSPCRLIDGGRSASMAIYILGTTARLTESVENIV